MDIVRCICARDSLGTLCGVPHPRCAIHGHNDRDPFLPWVLTWTDRKFLRTLQIDTEETQAIADVRQADEDRFNPPR